MPIKNENYYYLEYVSEKQVYLCHTHHDETKYCNTCDKIFPEFINVYLTIKRNEKEEIYRFKILGYG